MQAICKHYAILDKEVLKSIHFGIYKRPGEPIPHEYQELQIEFCWNFTLLDKVFSHVTQVSKTVPAVVLLRASEAWVTQGTIIPQTVTFKRLGQTQDDSFLVC